MFFEYKGPLKVSHENIFQKSVISHIYCTCVSISTIDEMPCFAITLNRESEKVPTINYMFRDEKVEGDGRLEFSTICGYIQYSVNAPQMTTYKLKITKALPCAVLLKTNAHSFLFSSRYISVSSQQIVNLIWISMSMDNQWFHGKT